jgi:NitT/TauT family transport system substrate-binding protein
MSGTPRRRLGALAALAVVTASLGLAACGGGDDAATPAAEDTGPVTLRLGHFPNLTHAQALVGLEQGIFAEKLGANVTLKPQSFNAGPAAIEALFSGAIDATYIGPNPTINGYVQSKGQGLNVIAGGASGGVALVVKPGINGVQDLKGKKIATPQLGNTQDVAIRYWLKQAGLSAPKEGGGDVTIVPQENALTVETFTAGSIDGAWVPEPFVTRLVNAGGKVLVDERDLWPDKKFVITNLIVSQKFLKEHPGTVKKLLEAHVAATLFVTTKPDEAQASISKYIGELTGKPLDIKLIKSAWPTLEFLNDPIASSLKAGADHAVEVGLLQKPALDGLYKLDLLNEVLKTQNLPAVKE